MHRLPTTGLLRLTYALIGTALAALAAPAASAQSPTHRLTELTDGVYAVEGRFQGANAAIIVTDRDVLIVDSHGTPASAAALLEDVAQLTNKPVRYVVNTHWHVDHHTGNQAYYRAFAGGVDFVAHRFTREDIPTKGREQLGEVLPFMEGPLDQARERLESGVDDHGNPLTPSERAQIERFIEAQAAFLADVDEFEFVLPSLTFAQRMVLHRDGRTIEVLHFFRAHTRGDVVVYLPEERILVAGDLLTKPILWTWASYPADYVRTLEALEQLDIDRIVIGHGDVLEGKAYLVQAREFLQAVVGLVQRGLAEGTSAEALLTAAMSDEAIQAFRFRFVEDSEEGNGMFDQMVAWTVERGVLEAGGEGD